VGVRLSHFNLLELIGFRIEQQLQLLIGKTPDLPEYLVVNLELHGVGEGF
jgi:hypothetical protein